MNANEDLPSNVPFTDRQLVQRAIGLSRAFSHRRRRGELVGLLFDVEEELARLICSKYGFDPDEEVPSYLD